MAQAKKTQTASVSKEVKDPKEAMTVPQLKELLNNKAIDYKPKATKAELIALLNGQKEPKATVGKAVNGEY